MRDGRAAGSPEALGTAASASASLAEQLRDWGRDPAAIEAAWRDAAQDGRTADTQAGRETAARVLLDRYDALREWGRGQNEIADAKRDAVAAARAAGTADALLAVGWSLCRVGTEESYREAAALAREAADDSIRAAFTGSRAGDWRLLAAEAGLGLGRALLQRAATLRRTAERPQEADTVFRDAIAALREAAAVGEAVGAPRGQELCGEAMLAVGDAYGGRKGRDAVTPRGLPAVINDKKYREALERAATAESAYRTATDAGMAAGSSAGQLIAAQAQFALGDAYQGGNGRGQRSMSCTALRPQRAARRVLRRASNGRRGRW